MTNFKPRLIIILGIAGSGKSTQAELLAKTASYRWLSTGELLRAKVDETIKAELLSGKLLDEEYVTELVSEDIHRPTQYTGIVLDGFPRSLSQANWLFNELDNGRLEVEAVVHFFVSEEQAKKRLLSRGRTDDHETAINERFDEYEQVIKPILKLFQEKNIYIVELKAEGSIDKIHQTVVEKLLSNGLSTV